MPWLKQSTAADIGIGPFLDQTDGNTPETALTITQPDIRLKKNGGAFAQKNAAQTLTHEEAGWYEVALDATDTNTLGILIIAIHESGALPVWKEYMVLPANVYDSLVSGTDLLDANVSQISEDATAADNLETMLDGTGGQILSLKSLVINNGAGVGLSVAGSTYAAQFNGTDAGVYILGVTGIALQVSSGFNIGALFSGGGALAGIKAVGGATGAGLEAIGGSTSGVGFKTTGVGAFPGLEVTGGSTGAGVSILGGSASGNAVEIAAQGGNSAGLVIEGEGSGSSIDATISGNLSGNVIGSVGSLTTVSAGAITTSSFAAGAINAAAIAPDAIGASELATSAVSEIVSGIGGVGAFAITVTVNDGAAALQNVNVTVFDGGGATAGRGTTDALGNASFSLAAGTYTVALNKANYNFAPVSRTVTGFQAGSIVTAMSMTIIAPIAASGTPGVCVVAGYIKDLNGNALVGSLVKARLVPPNNKRPVTSDGVVLGLEADTAVTDGLGYVTMELIRTDEISPYGCTYTIKCEDAQIEKKNVSLAVATLDIATL